MIVRRTSWSGQVAGAALLCATLLGPVANAAAGSSEDIDLPKIDRNPPPFQLPPRDLLSLPDCDPANAFAVDLRNANLEELDLRQDLDRLLCATFDDDTRWPAAGLLPAEFDPGLVMELGTEPGLGVRWLHEHGITGQGVGIAIIDQPLLVDHVEYRDNLVLYEESHLPVRDMNASMHGGAVASIALGKTCGVAPGASLYYHASWLLDGEGQLTYSYYAQALRRLLEVNDQLPAGEKIRVIAIQRGWVPEDGGAGYDDIVAACEEARNLGIFVISSSLEGMYGWPFGGLGRPPLADPGLLTSWTPGLSWSEWFEQHGSPAGMLLVPMDSRTVASQAGTAKYAFHAEGGWSWAIPYIAGVYALAAEVDPSITPERFWSLALWTAATVEIESSQVPADLGAIIQPAALIQELVARQPRRPSGRTAPGPAHAAAASSSW